MKAYLHLLLSALLIAAGGFLLIVGSVLGKPVGVLLGAAIAIIAGIVSILLVRGYLSQRMGLVIGIVLCALASGVEGSNFWAARQMSRSPNGSLDGSPYTPVISLARHPMDPFIPIRA